MSVEEETYNKLKKDKELKKQRKALTSWMHGTHIGAIAVNATDLPRELSQRDLKALIITYLGKAESGPAKSPRFEPTASQSTTRRNNHIRHHWKKYLDWQINKLKISIDYGKSKAVVFNGSFGQSFKGATEMVSSAHKEQFGEDLSEKLAKKKALEFMRELLTRATNLLSKYPNHLFVFSAGNKKSNTDELLHFPSNVRLPNVISVGASYKRETMAYFSNFGKAVLVARSVAAISIFRFRAGAPCNQSPLAVPLIALLASKISSSKSSFILSRFGFIVAILILVICIGLFSSNIAMNVSIFEITGKKVIETTTANPIDVSALASGVYVVQVADATSSTTAKLVIK